MSHGPAQAATVAHGGRLTVSFAELTDVGHRRLANDDAIASALAVGGLLFAVADGVSGLPGARRASQTALGSFIGALAGAADRKPIHQRLRAAAERANLDVHDQARSDPALRSMRTTLTATAIVGDVLAAVHVGDCRLYLLRSARLECLTRDHSSFWRHHVLTRSLGENPIVRVDIVRKRLRYGDVLLQCSDGLYNAVSAPRMAMVLASEPPESACRTLARLARAGTGGDDVSVQVALLHA